MHGRQIYTFIYYYYMRFYAVAELILWWYLPIYTRMGNILIIGRGRGGEASLPHAVHAWMHMSATLTCMHEVHERAPIGKNAKSCWLLRYTMLFRWDIIDLVNNDYQKSHNGYILFKLYTLMYNNSLYIWTLLDLTNFCLTILCSCHIQSDCTQQVHGSAGIDSTTTDVIPTHDSYTWSHGQVYT